MKNRRDILNNLINFNGSLKEIQNELLMFPWDIDVPIITMTKNILSNVLLRCINNEKTFTELEDWANLIECRDDISFEDDGVQNTIFELSNPEINGQITVLLLENIIESFTPTSNG